MITVRFELYKRSGYPEGFSKEMSCVPRKKELVNSGSVYDLTFIVTSVVWHISEDDDDPVTVTVKGEQL